jgi:hypothetical protein
MINIDQCGGKERKSTIVRITTTYSDYQSCDFERKIFYTCMYDRCNNKTIANSVSNIAFKFHKSCMMDYEENINKHSTSTTISSIDTIMFNRSFITNIANAARQDFRILIKIGLFIFVFVHESAFINVVI